MSWIGGWIGNWLGGWLDYENIRQPQAEIIELTSAITTTISFDSQI